MAVQPGEWECMPMPVAVRRSVVPKRPVRRISDHFNPQRNALAWVLNVLAERAWVLFSNLSGDSRVHIVGRSATHLSLGTIVHSHGPLYRRGCSARRPESS